MCKIGIVNIDDKRFDRIVDGATCILETYGYSEKATLRAVDAMMLSKPGYLGIRYLAEGLVNIPLQIKGMKVSLSLREDTERDNLIWVSIRSVDDFPCNKMAEQYFNGGGHLNAAGGRLNCSLAEAELTVRKAFDEFCVKYR